MPPGFTDTLNTYLAQTQATQMLLALIFALFVVWQFIRSFGGRDKTLNTVVTQLSLVISQQTKTTNERDEEYRQLFKEIADRNAKADQRWMTLLDSNTDTQLRHAVAVEALGKTADALSANTANNAILLVEHDKFARGGVSDIMSGLDRVDKKIDEALKGISEIRAFYPDDRTDRLSNVEQQLAEAIELLKDCGKKATDEHPAVDIAPIEQTPETGDALTPGQDAAA